MTDNKQLSQALTETLQLETPPVALRFVERAPEGMPSFAGEVPSACTFWRRAEQGTFFADAPAHFNCLIGTHTMGLPMPEEKGKELMDLIGEMGAAEYVDGGEVPHIPTVPGRKNGIVYGPLADIQEEPDAVLLWLTPAQAMLLEEATGASRWSANSGIPTFGRPSCAAIPAAMASGSSALSLGCRGMRVFTEVAQNAMLGVLPKQLLSELPESLDRIARSNEVMGQRYRGQKAIHTKGPRQVPAAN